MKKTEISPKIQKAILALLKENAGSALPRKQISHFLNIRKKEYHVFEASLTDLVREGVIKKTNGHKYMSQQVSHFKGELRTARAGFGFVVVEDMEDDIFVSRSNLNTAFDRDTVEVQLYAKTRGKRQEGFITKVHERFRKQVVGTYRQTEYYSFVVPDSPKIYRDIVVPQDRTLDAKDGQKVLVNFDQWDSAQHNPEGHIAEVLGDADAPGVDIISVAYSYNLPVRFTDDLEAEAKKATGRILKKDLQDRLDLRDMVCFTIDPIDAKDFDDAVSLEKLDNGNVKLGVHIADVSHYVKPDSPIDKEAYKRGTSIYLVDRVIPMLPEHLSNDLCSLKPNVDRMAFSCFMEIDADLKLVDYQVAPSIINSNKRYNYEEFQSDFDMQKKVPYLETINDMFDLSKRLTRQRFEDGSIDFETPEVRFILDEKGQPTEVIPKKRLGAHRLVEEFMLMANKTVAEHIIKISPKKSAPFPFIYRIHEKPDPEKMNKFFNLLKALKVPFKPAKKISSKYFQTVLDKIKGKPEEVIIREVALRSMMKAVYSEKNIGHFGLSFRDYTHFTSPIRRYPDLVVHRLLKMYATNEIKNPKGLRKNIKEMCLQTSKMERLAVEAERESIKLKQCEYINKHIGDQFHGIISGVTAYGIYVEIEETFIEGFVQMTNMSDDFYVYEEASYSMTGRNTGRRISLGDQVEIKVESVNLEKREIDFILLEDPDFEPLVPEAIEKPKNKKRRPRRKR
ncbi:MAG: ribonuclease R [Calditrichaeota bacterium]|nr:MAG: ribonuclease R [Calditrichota bacterium]MBL1204875.1 ribonuclease R [Calditrichota bacterium]NOG44704.1 ribonuclease R [Calditrichota bacterium]